MERQMVLVIDDAPANVELVRAILKTDYDVVTAASGPDALELIGAKKPDLILLDVMMPGLDGHQLCRILKSDPGTSDIPVIFVTALSRDDDEVKGLELGAIDYLTKPIKPHILKTRVRNHLDLKHYRDLLEELSTAADRTKKEFLRSVSHELRTPLTPILGMTDLVLSKEEDEEKRKYLVLVQKAALKLLGIIEDLIETSRLQGDGVEVDHTTFSLRAFVDGVMGEIRPLAGAKNLDLRVTLDPALPEALTTDAGMLHKVLAVLLGNAVKFTPEGVVTLDVRRQEGELGPRILFAVADTGVGIPPGDLGRIFDGFTQSDATVTRAFPGLGLGLTLAKRIAELMRGSISADSRPGGGSLFTFEIPLLPPPDLAGLR